MNVLLQPQRVAPHVKKCRSLLCNLWPFPVSNEEVNKISWEVIDGLIKDQVAKATHHKLSSLSCK